MKNLKYLFFGIAVGIVYWLFFAGAEKKDFFECGADNTLVACPVGETPSADTYGDCRAVGDGDTTLDDGDCS
jgi:hypothetical protein